MKIPQVPIAAAKHYADNAWHLGGWESSQFWMKLLLNLRPIGLTCPKGGVGLCYQYAKHNYWWKSES